MAIFNSELLVYQRVSQIISHESHGIYPHPTFPWISAAPSPATLGLRPPAPPRAPLPAWQPEVDRNGMEMENGNGTPDSDSLNLKNHVHHVDTRFHPG